MSSVRFANEFRSLCYGDGTRKKGEGSFTVIGNLPELLAAFSAHVQRYHSQIVAT